MKEPAEETARISDLKLDPKNARRRTQRGSAMLEKSLEEIGAARSIVIDENNRILAGNGTVEAAGQVGIERVRIIEADGNEIIAVRRRHLTDEEKTKLALYDNRTAELAQWDGNELLAIQAENAGLLDAMFFEGELSQMFPDRFSQSILGNDEDFRQEDSMSPFNRGIARQGGVRVLVGDLETVISESAYNAINTYCEQNADDANGRYIRHILSEVIENCASAL